MSISLDAECTKMIWLWKSKIPFCSQVAPQIKERMIKKGSLMIGYQKLDFKGKRNFFRMVIHATPPPTREDMEYVINEIERCGKDL